MITRVTKTEFETDDGVIHDIPFEFECKKCDNKIDRDLNASINLKNLAVSSTVSACGEQSSSNESLVSCSVKQEFNKKSRVYILKI